MACTGGGSAHERFPRAFPWRLACPDGAGAGGISAQRGLAHARAVARRRRRRGLRTAGLGARGRNRDSRRRDRANPGVSAGRAGKRAGIFALWRGDGRTRGVYRDTPIDLRWRGLRRGCYARRQMVAGLIGEAKMLNARSIAISCLAIAAALVATNVRAAEYP